MAILCVLGKMSRPLCPIYVIDYNLQYRKSSIKPPFQKHEIY